MIRRWASMTHDDAGHLCYMLDHERTSPSGWGSRSQTGDRFDPFSNLLNENAPTPPRRHSTGNHNHLFLWHDGFVESLGGRRIFEPATRGEYGGLFRWHDGGVEPTGQVGAKTVAGDPPRRSPLVWHDGTLDYAPAGGTKPTNLDETGILQYAATEASPETKASAASRPGGNPSATADAEGVRVRSRALMWGNGDAVEPRTDPCPPPGPSLVWGEDAQPVKPLRSERTHLTDLNHTGILQYSASEASPETKELARPRRPAPTSTPRTENHQTFVWHDGAVDRLIPDSTVTATIVAADRALSRLAAVSQHTLEAAAELRAATLTAAQQRTASMANKAPPSTPEPHSAALPSLRFLALDPTSQTVHEATLTTSNPAVGDAATTATNTTTNTAATATDSDPAAMLAQLESPAAFVPAIARAQEEGWRLVSGGTRQLIFSRGDTATAAGDAVDTGGQDAAEGQGRRRRRSSRTARLGRAVGTATTAAAACYAAGTVGDGP